MRSVRKIWPFTVTGFRRHQTLTNFARKSTIFTNFYSGSTFTTSSVATMLTGLYPSESRVYQTQSHVPIHNAGKTFPGALRDAGFATGAFLSNSNAYYLAEGLQNAFEFLPEPTYQQGGLQHLWDVTTPLHQNSGFGSRLEEYVDLMGVWNTVARLPHNLYVRYRAVDSFEHASEIVAQLPEGFFLWVHVMTPHSPYLPDMGDRGSFLAADQKLRTFDEEGTPWKPHYKPDEQGRRGQVSPALRRVHRDCRPRLRNLHVGPREGRANCAIQLSSFQPITEKVLKAVCINMRVLIRLGRSFISP